MSASVGNTIVIMCMYCCNNYCTIPMQSIYANVLHVSYVLPPHTHACTHTHAHTTHTHTHTHTHTLLELNEFVLQLDEEVEAMQSTILHLQQQAKLRDSREAALVALAKTGVAASKERTSSKANGPVDSHSSSSGASTSKLASRSQDS